MSKSTHYLAKKTYLLLAASTGLVKIGQSASPLTRMAELRTMNACEVEPLCVLRVPEADLHKRFADCRHHGEWFKVCTPMIDYLFDIHQDYVAERLIVIMQDDHEIN